MLKREGGGGLSMGMLWGLMREWCMGNDTANIWVHWREDVSPTEEPPADASYWSNIDDGHMVGGKMFGMVVAAVEEYGTAYRAERKWAARTGLC